MANNSINDLDKRIQNLLKGFSSLSDKYSSAIEENTKTIKKLNKSIGNFEKVQEKVDNLIGRISSLYDSEKATPEFFETITRVFSHNGKTLKSFESKFEEINTSIDKSREKIEDITDEIKDVQETIEEFKEVYKDNQAYISKQLFDLKKSPLFDKRTGTLIKGFYTKSMKNLLKSETKKDTALGRIFNFVSNTKKGFVEGKGEEKGWKGFAKGALGGVLGGTKSIGSDIHRTLLNSENSILKGVGTLTSLTRAGIQNYKSNKQNNKEVTSELDRLFEEKIKTIALQNSSDYRSYTKSIESYQQAIQRRTARGQDTSQQQLLLDNAIKERNAIAEQIKSQIGPIIRQQIETENKEQLVQQISSKNAPLFAQQLLNSLGGWNKSQDIAISGDKISEILESSEGVLNTLFSESFEPLRKLAETISDEKITEYEDNRTLYEEREKELNAVREESISVLERQKLALDSLTNSFDTFVKEMVKTFTDKNKLIEFVKNNRTSIETEADNIGNDINYNTSLTELSRRQSAQRNASVSLFDNKQLLSDALSNINDYFTQDRDKISDEQLEKLNEFDNEISSLISSLDDIINDDDLILSKPIKQLIDELYTSLENINNNTKIDNYDSLEPVKNEIVSFITRINEIKTTGSLQNDDSDTINNIFKDFSNISEFLRELSRNITNEKSFGITQTKNNQNDLKNLFEEYFSGVKNYFNRFKSSNTQKEILNQQPSASGNPPQNLGNKPDSSGKDVKDKLLLTPKPNNNGYEADGPIPVHLMANGGIVNKAISAIVGEAGPEAIIPLEKIETFMSDIFAKRTSSETEVDQEFHNNIERIADNTEIIADNIDVFKNKDKKEKKKGGLLSGLLPDFGELGALGKTFGKLLGNVAGKLGPLLAGPAGQLFAGIAAIMGIDYALNWAFEKGANAAGITPEDLKRGAEAAEQQGAQNMGDGIAMGQLPEGWDPDKFKNLKGHWNPFEWFKDEKPKEPAKMAEGGVVTQPTNAIVGEGGEPEAIVPFSKIGSFFEKVFNPEAISGKKSSADFEAEQRRTNAIIKLAETADTILDVINGQYHKRKDEEKKNPLLSFLSKALPFLFKPLAAIGLGIQAIKKAILNLTAKLAIWLGKQAYEKIMKPLGKYFANTKAGKAVLSKFDKMKNSKFVRGTKAGYAKSKSAMIQMGLIEGQDDDEMSIDTSEKKKRKKKKLRRRKKPAISNIAKIAQRSGAQAASFGRAAKAGGKALFKGAARALGPIAAGAMSLWDGISGYNDKDLHQRMFNLKEGEEASTMQKLGAGAASAVSGLTFGLVDPETIAKVGSTIIDTTKDAFMGLVGMLKKGFVKLAKFLNPLNIFKSIFKGIKSLLPDDIVKWIEKYNPFTWLSNKLESLGDWFKNLDIVKSVRKLLPSWLGGISEEDELTEKFNDIKKEARKRLEERIDQEASRTPGSETWAAEQKSKLSNEEIEALARKIAGERGITLPKMASGGILDTATPVVIAEEGPEAVIPLDKLPKFMDDWDKGEHGPSKRDIWKSLAYGAVEQRNPNASEDEIKRITEKLLENEDKKHYSEEYKKALEQNEKLLNEQKSKDLKNDLVQVEESKKMDNRFAPITEMAEKALDFFKETSKSLDKMKDDLKAALTGESSQSSSGGGAPASPASSPAGSSGGYGGGMAGAPGGEGGAFPVAGGGGDHLGVLSSKFESGGNSSAIGWDRGGGTSYGRFQIAAKTGTFGSFLNFCETEGGQYGQEVAARLRAGGDNVGGKIGETGSKNGRTPEIWKQLAAEGKIQDLEYRFIKKTHYDVSYKKLLPELKQMVDANPVLQEVLWSNAVQGPGFVKNFNEAYRPGISPQELISAVYDRRATQFKNQNAQIQESARRRMANEKNIALGWLGNGNAYSQARAQYNGNFGANGQISNQAINGNGGPITQTPIQGAAGAAAIPAVPAPVPNGIPAPGAIPAGAIPVGPQTIPVGPISPTGQPMAQPMAGQPMAPTIAQTGSSGFGSTIADNARRVLASSSGVYKLGAKGQGGMYDCTGFVNQTLKVSNLPKELTNELAMNNANGWGRVLEKWGFQRLPYNMYDTSNLMPGDILWKSGQAHGHVEIYAGNGMNIGAHSSKSGISERRAAMRGTEFTYAYRMPPNLSSHVQPGQGPAPAAPNGPAVIPGGLPTPAAGAGVPDMSGGAAPSITQQPAAGADPMAQLQQTFQALASVLPPGLIPPELLQAAGGGTGGAGAAAAATPSTPSAPGMPSTPTLQQTPSTTPTPAQAGMQAAAGGSAGGKGLGAIAHSFDHIRYGMYKTSSGGYSRYSGIKRNADGSYSAGTRNGVATLDCSQFVSAVMANAGYTKWADKGGTAESMRQDLRAMGGGPKDKSQIGEGDIAVQISQAGSKSAGRTGAGRAHHIGVVIRDPNTGELQLAESTGSSTKDSLTQVNGGTKYTPLMSSWVMKGDAEVYNSPASTGVGNLSPEGYKMPPAGEAAASGLTPGGQPSMSDQLAGAGATANPAASPAAAAPAIQDTAQAGMNAQASAYYSAGGAAGNVTVNNNSNGGSFSQKASEFLSSVLDPMGWAVLQGSTVH